MRYGHDAPASQRARVLVSESVRHAPELRRTACAGARSSAVGSLRRASVLVRQQATRQAEDFVLGSGWLLACLALHRGRMPWAAYERFQRAPLFSDFSTGLDE